MTDSNSGPSQDQDEAPHDTTANNTTAEHSAERGKSMNTEPAQQWEYAVYHVNFSKDQHTSPSASEASEKLGGTLSPEFIRKEFPEQYQKAPPTHPAEQLRVFLNTVGSKGWELTSTTHIGPLLMFIFRRPKPQPSAQP
ncbi:MAG: hypothetical protein ERJ67_02075 [Aphanocapsa feldmannii 277cV]|uniref:Uncharacterized protein n=2 Tax=Aphanocapsa feldmannii TaxID=192050 RepID=A0A524RQ64_9CHRO|nr:MAG: hypothetical protein ERJ69_09200 [Aphanocapsa feldmannii 288cV]TGG94586.1 MAG: hypothetical protein ERJ67_02075 [Aphanocapsa feldmannii 277cV]TGH21107.1 MAG: hypothetical protein ERJ68_05980 [Aphanocapsa feldmannii 277cI]